MSVINAVWVVAGFSLGFGDSIGGIIGNPLTYFMFRGVGGDTHPGLSPTVPLLLFSMFQLKFSIITPTLITGSFAERVRFSSYILFMILFTLFIYSPLAHMTWHPDGLLRKMGVLDFAGGTVVHMSAGFAALAGAMLLGRRRSHMKNELHIPSNITYVILGTGLLWFGWFGFNAGSAVAADGLAASAFVVTNTSAAAAGFTWSVLEWIHHRKPTILGACSGAVAGQVAITPASGFVGPMASIAIGVGGGLVCFYCVTKMKKALGYDDALDVISI